MHNNDANKKSSQNDFNLKNLEEYFKKEHNISVEIVKSDNLPNQFSQEKGYLAHLSNANLTIYNKVEQSNKSFKLEKIAESEIPKLQTKDTTGQGLYEFVKTTILETIQDTNKKQKNVVKEDNQVNLNPLKNLVVTFEQDVKPSKPIISSSLKNNDIKPKL